MGVTQNSELTVACLLNYIVEEGLLMKFPISNLRITDVFFGGDKIFRLKPKAHRKPAAHKPLSNTSEHFSFNQLSYMLTERQP